VGPAAALRVSAWILERVDPHIAKRIARAGSHEMGPRGIISTSFIGFDTWT